MVAVDLCYRVVRDVDDGISVVYGKGAFLRGDTASLGNSVAGELTRLIAIIVAYFRVEVDL